MDAKRFGRWGEERAASHLESLGYKLVAQNWRSEHGEVDIVALHEGQWVFVEVKARRTRKFGTPEEAVTPARQRRLLEVARAYLVEHGLEDVDWRVDVVAITAPRGDTSRPRVEVYQNAVPDW